MAADSLGNDIAAVGVPVTGFIGYAPIGTTIPTPVEGGDPDLTLAAGFKKLGLLKTDGGFTWAEEADGDPIEFWQEGYSIPSGLANVTLTAGLAQLDENVRSFLRGKTADANGYMTIDGGGTATRYVIFTEEVFKNGVIRRRVAPDVGIQSQEPDQSTRGEVNGTNVTLTVARSSLVDGEHYGEWLIAAE
jgi:hypothetical protein